MADRDDSEAGETSQVPVDAPPAVPSAAGAPVPPPHADAPGAVAPPPPPEADIPAAVAPPPATEPEASGSEASSSGGLPVIGGELAEQRPELVAAGAFAGAFLLAKILKRLGGGR